MSTTPNLLIAHIAASQNNKEVTANTGFDDFDGAITDLLTISMTTANYTMTTGVGSESLGHLCYKLTGAIGAARNLIVPVNKKLYIVSNQTSGGFAVTVKTPSGTGIALDSTAYVILYCDGTNVIALAASTSSGGTIAASQITSGQVALARGGTHADLSGTGGAHKFLRQNSSGADIDVVQIANADLTEYAVANATAQVANIAATTLGTPVSSGRYRVSGYIVLTTVDGASSTLPSIVITWTDPDNNTAQSLTLTPTNAGNVLTTLQQETAIISAKIAVAIQYATSGYASGTPATMAYAVHLVLERL